MPCYTVRLISVEFKAQNEKVLQAAADLLNCRFIKYGNQIQIGNVTVDLDTQTARGRQEDINALKRAYGQAAVRIAAKAKGWTLSKWTDKAGTLSTTATKY